MTKLHKNTQDQNLVDIVAEQLDSIYYPGYAEELMESDPVKFEWELKELAGQLAGVED
ncbi:MAG: hypothetical protein NTU98_06335 [Bacteroidetes bacterium]|nr:hypothetical protein [Bacteroidota bacterium]